VGVRDRIIAIANQELGTGDNRDTSDIHELDKYFIDTGKSIAGADTTTSWCGIFACWVLLKSGLYVSWTQKIFDPAKTQVELIQAEGGDKGKGIRPGDVGVIHHRIHHFVVVQAYTGSDSLITIEGNYLGRKHDCIRRSYERTRGGLWYYYRVLPN